MPGDGRWSFEFDDVGTDAQCSKDTSLATGLETVWFTVLGTSYKSLLARAFSNIPCALASFLGTAEVQASLKPLSLGNRVFEITRIKAKLQYPIRMVRNRLQS